MEIRFAVKNQALTRLDDNTVVEKSRGYLTARFEFSDDWDGLTKTAIFRHNKGTPWEMLLDAENVCDVPWEATLAGEMEVSVFGGDLITTNAEAVIVEPSGYTKGETPSDPTPDVYTQIIEQVSALSDGYLKVDHGTASSYSLDPPQVLHTSVTRNIYELLPDDAFKLLLSADPDASIVDMKDSTETYKDALLGCMRGSAGGGPDLVIPGANNKIVIEVTAPNFITVSRFTELFYYAPVNAILTVDVYEPVNNAWKILYRFDPQRKAETFVEYTHLPLYLYSESSREGQYSAVRYTITRSSASGTLTRIFSLHEKGIFPANNSSYNIRYDGYGTILPKGLNMGGKAINDVGYPKAASDAANMAYVDAMVAATSGASFYITGITSGAPTALKAPDGTDLSLGNLPNGWYEIRLLTTTGNANAASRYTFRKTDTAFTAITTEFEGSATNAPRMRVEDNVCNCYLNTAAGPANVNELIKKLW